MKAASENFCPWGALKLLDSLARPLGPVSCRRSGELGLKEPSTLNTSSFSSSQYWGSFTLFPCDTSITVTCISTPTQCSKMLVQRGSSNVAVETMIF